MWFLAGCAVGLLVALMIKITPAPVAVEGDGDGEAENSTETLPEPIFDFYTVLPEPEVVSVNEELVTAQRAAVREASVSSEPEPVADQKRSEETPADSVDPVPIRVREPGSEAGVKFLLQAGSFKSAKDAERLKDRLEGAGQKPRIVKVQVGSGETWHRVQLGPLETEYSVDQARKVLTGMNIEGLLLRVKEP